MKTNHHLKPFFLVPLVTIGLLGLVAQATPNNWTGGGDGAHWSDPLNWSAGLPDTGHAVSIDAGAILLTSETAELASFTMTGGTLTFSNWMTRLRATEVVITNNAVLTLPPAFTDAGPSNRVWIVCANFTLVGTISAEAKGFKAENGTGKGGRSPGGELWSTAGSGAGYGGQGEYLSLLRGPGGCPYGSLSEPSDPGSGGGGVFSEAYMGGSGGGAVLIDASGTVTLNGTINANGQTVTTRKGAGSGGSIWIKCATLTGNGAVLSARGGTSDRTYGGAGGGGRIALQYGTLDNFTNWNIDTRAGTGRSLDIKTHRFRFLPGDGTVWCSTTNLLAETMNNDRFTGVRFFAPGFTRWSPSSLTINTSIRFEEDGFQLTVENDLTIGEDGALGLGLSSGENGAALNCGGDLTVDGGQLHVYAGSIADAANQNADPGATVAVTGAFVVTNGGWVFPHAPGLDVGNGGAVRFTARSVTVDETSGFSATARGYLGRNGPGMGATSGWNGSGGGYGGKGTDQGALVGGATNGLALAPIRPGSGGGGGTVQGGSGGGVIWLEIEETARLKGTFYADGGLYNPNLDGNHQAASGAGGSILVSARDILAPFTAVFQAKGGNGRQGVASAVGGGGGRIAFWKRMSAASRAALFAGEQPANLFVSETAEPRFKDFLAEPSVLGGLLSTGDPGDPGTVRFVEQLPPRGTLIMFR